MQISKTIEQWNHRQHMKLVLIRGLVTLNQMSLKNSGRHKRSRKRSTCLTLLDDKRQHIRVYNINEYEENEITFLLKNVFFPFKKNNLRSCVSYWVCQGICTRKMTKASHY